MKYYFLLLKYYLFSSNFQYVIHVKWQVYIHSQIWYPETNILKGGESPFITYGGGPAVVMPWRDRYPQAKKKYPNVIFFFLFLFFMNIWELWINSKEIGT